VNENIDSEVEARLLRYVQIDTQSDESSQSVPSTAKQLNLLNMLVDELKEIGIEETILTDYGTVIGSLPATQGLNDAPTVAFLAHVDTAPAYSGSNVQPLVHRSYDGSAIVLPIDPEMVLNEETAPELAGKIGEDIITASGDTLLGADDKAGCAVIMTLAAELIARPEIAHGPLRFCFTPDEEIGRGVDPRLPADLGADVAYTLDGGQAGEIVYETFSADKALVSITGVSIHPGTAKDKLVNALHLAAKIIDTLPQITRTPETTDKKEGFIHLYQMTGTAAQAELHFILRDFARGGLAAHGELVERVCGTIQATEPRAQIECTITPQYRNMHYWLEDDMRPVELAMQACRDEGIEPLLESIRGGTDGSRLTELGLPTPNIFTGMYNLHGPLEWISVQDMVMSTKVCVKLVECWSRENISGGANGRKADQI